MSTEESTTYKNALSLDDIRKAADRKYGHVEVVLDDGTEVVLLNPLRLSKERRAELKALQAAAKAEQEGEAGEETDQLDRLRATLRTVAKYRPAVDKLLEQIGDDLAVMAELLSYYNDRCQPGEASA